MRRGLLAAADLERALAAHRSSGERLGRVLLSMGLVRRQDLHRVLGEIWGVGFCDLTRIRVDEVLLRLFAPSRMASEEWLPVDRRGRVVWVATAEPPSVRVQAVLQEELALDYPQEKLEILLLMVEEDHETIAAARAAQPPDTVKFVIVPRGRPQTKPRACNMGLVFSHGEFLVIYDAEDRPEPGQLREAVAAFRAGDETLACVQARLNYFNAEENLLTRMFTLEYSWWFDYMLPGLDRLRLPIPLGGTSNHFRGSASAPAGSRATCRPGWCTRAGPSAPPGPRACGAWWPGAGGRCTSSCATPSTGRRPPTG